MDSEQHTASTENKNVNISSFAEAMASTIPNITSPPRIFRSSHHRHSSSSAADNEASSDVHSLISSDGNYELIEFDLPEETNKGNGNNHQQDQQDKNNEDSDYSDDVFDEGPDADLLQEAGAVSIQEDSPAAAALRANAEIQVSSLGKAARAVHMQSVRRVLKRAAGKGRSNRIKGKPPRVPYGATAQSHIDEFAADYHDGYHFAYDEDEEEEEEGAATTASASTQSDRKMYLSVTTGTGDLAVHPELDEEENQDDDDRNDHQHLIVDDKEIDELSIEQDHKKHPLPLTPKTPEHPADMGNHIPDGVVPGTVEAGKKVLGSVDPHDLLKLVRWRRKKKGTLAKIKPKSYVKGKVIDGQHELYTLSIAVMIGVRTSISRSNTELNRGPGRRWVRPADFRATEKYEFRPKGAGPLPPHQLAHTFKFKDYSPVVFAYLRRLSGVNEFDFLLSVCGNANFIEFISNAKSGQFFFYSSDGRYMIKTMTNAESKFLRRMLPIYFKHCCENPNTMVTKFFGMYRVKLYHLRRNVKFVIMNSVYYTDKHLQTFYDLKGSSLGRDAKPGQAVLKDNDLRKSLPENAFVFRPNQRVVVRQQLVSDCRFLCDMGVMDYSMLVGVHHVPAGDAKSNMAAVGSLRNISSHNKANSTGRGRKNTAGSSFSNASGAGHPFILDDGTLSPDFSPTVSAGVGAGAGVHDSLKASAGHSHRGGTSNGHNRQRSDTLGTFVFENGLEDDENSYLLGSENRPGSTVAKKMSAVNEETERKKQATIEKLFWPFHHLFDIHGHRRLKPARCPKCESAPCICVDEQSKALLKGYNIPAFVPPLSDRKDGGLEMDTTDMHMPKKLRTPLAGGNSNNHNEMLYGGKIFYMGIIDILQEYNSRKVLESRYRSFTAPERMSASCVAPRDYGRRFIEFFDQFTTRQTDLGAGGGGRKTQEEGVEVEA